MSRWTSKASARQAELITRWSSGRIVLDRCQLKENLKSFQNALKHGLRSKEAIEAQRETNQLLKELR